MEKMKLGFDNLVAVAAATPAELVVGEAQKAFETAGAVLGGVVGAF